MFRRAFSGEQTALRLLKGDMADLTVRTTTAPLLNLHPLQELLILVADELDEV